mgnify:CR=1 FL=1
MKLKAPETVFSSAGFCPGCGHGLATRLIGEANVVNIVGALAVACEYGIPPTELRGAVRALKCVPHRMELIDRGPILIIDDAFNSNPAGAKAALETVALFGDAMKIIVTPGMIELGEKEAECNACLLYTSDAADE